MENVVDEGARPSCEDCTRLIERKVSSMSGSGCSNKHGTAPRRSYQKEAKLSQVKRYRRRGRGQLDPDWSSIIRHILAFTALSCLKAPRFGGR